MRYPSLFRKGQKEIDTNELTQLVDKAKQNDAESLAKFCEYLYPKLYTYIYYRVNQVEDAEDLASEVILRIMKNLKTQKGSFLAWAYKIASNLVIDFYRYHSIRQEEELSEEYESVYGHSPDKDIENALTQEELRKALARLTEEQREVIILKFIQGYKNNEIAEIMDKSIGAIKLLQFRALKSLRELLQEKI